MDEVRDDWLKDDKKHRSKSSFILTIISHGGRDGIILSTDRKPIWTVESILQALSGVKSLKEKPKILFIQTCRGSMYFSALLFFFL